jgi:UDP-N-acetylglucosamine pyrophosphorylase
VILQQQSCSDLATTDSCDSAATNSCDSTATNNYDPAATNIGDFVATDSYDPVASNSNDSLYHNDSSWWNAEGHGSIMEALRKSKCVEIISWLLIQISTKYFEVA